MSGCQSLIAEFNQQVRNALKLIALSFTEPDEVERVRLVKEAAERIDRLLQRLSADAAGWPKAPQAALH